MITKLKIYESVNQGEPEIGDWVICNELCVYQKLLISFIEDNIGRIIDYEEEETKYVILYEKIPNKISRYFFDRFDSLQIGDCRRMFRREIIYWSKDKEVLEALMSASKYNL